MTKRAGIDEIRSFYARLMAAASRWSDPRLERAFEAIPREAFCPPGPWRIVFHGRPVDTPSADPAYLYQDVLVALDAAKGINNGDMVKVSSNRGYIKAVAVVTKRIPRLTVDGKPVDTVGLPNHWGFVGLTKPGYLVNTLTPFVGDANTQTPEYKSFTVNIEKA